jgi:hypothetical protein
MENGTGYKTLGWKETHDILYDFRIKLKQKNKTTRTRDSSMKGVTGYIGRSEDQDRTKGWRA